MGSFLLYVLKSTFCIGLLYLVFRMVMRKEIFFALNRVLLLAVVIGSTLIPLINLPKVIQPEIQQKLIPAFPEIENTLPELPVVADVPQISRKASVAAEKPESAFPVVKTIGYIYIAGMLFTFLIFIHGIATILFMLGKAKAIRKDGYLVFIIEKDIPAFSFCKMIFISKSDYLEHGKTILTHELQHIRLGHFYDLMLMEMIKMIHWFNPVIYWLIQDLKAIHEFQADRHTLTKGIDANKYQLLIIEKGVGSQRFALANSFNHCQIKKRITMMNKQMTSKAGIWKVATFLPLLALLLMAFGKSGEKEPLSTQPQKSISNQKSVQVKDTTTRTEEKVYQIAERMPEFPGGQKALNKYLADNIKYPLSAAKAKIQGKVFVAFIITSQGKVIHPKVVRSIDPELDAEALRVISIMPNWAPAKEKGKPVSVHYTIPVNFILYPDPSKKNLIIVPDNGTQKKDKPSSQNNDKSAVFKDNFNVFLLKDGKFRYNSNYTQLDENELEEKIKSELQRNPKLQFIVSIEEGKIDERVDQVKEILKRNGNPKVSFEQLHIEMGKKDSNGQYSPVWITKPMTIK